MDAGEQERPGFRAPLCSDVLKSYAKKTSIRRPNFLDMFGAGRDGGPVDADDHLDGLLGADHLRRRRLGMETMASKTSCPTSTASLHLKAAKRTSRSTTTLSAGRGDPTVSRELGSDAQPHEGQRRLPPVRRGGRRPGEHEGRQDVPEEKREELWDRTRAGATSGVKPEKAPDRYFIDRAYEALDIPAIRRRRRPGLNATWKSATRWPRSPS